MTLGTGPFPENSDLTICFAHVAYQMAQTFGHRATGINHFQTWSSEDTLERLQEADVLVISGFWENGLLDVAPRLRFIQGIGAGYDRFPLDTLRERGIRFANATGVNRNAVSEHALALILALSRKIPEARDHQRRKFWRQMISDIPRREDELAGKTLGIIGPGAIGSRVASLGKAFDMRVIGTKRDPSTYEGPADEIWPTDRLDDLLAQSDFVVLTCALTPETRGLIDSRRLALMKPSAFLINVARGACVDEPALIDALEHGKIAGAGLDTFWDDPLPPESVIWDMDQVIVTPHTGGETQMYESNVIDILVENLDRLGRGETKLFNEIV